MSAKLTVYSVDGLQWSHCQHHNRHTSYKHVFHAIYHITAVYKQEGLAVASIARDDHSTLPGNDPFPSATCTATAMRGKLGSEFET